MGSGAVVVTDNDQALAVELARELALVYWDARFELEPESWTPEEAITAGLGISGGPISWLKQQTVVEAVRQGIAWRR